MVFSGLSPLVIEEVTDEGERFVVRARTLLAAVTSRPRGKRIADVAEQLVRLLVHAHHPACRIVGPGVDSQDVLHPASVFHGGLGRGD